MTTALVSPLHIWVVDAATDAPNLASTLNQGAFNLGNATGAWLGGVVLTAGDRGDRRAAMVRGLLHTPGADRSEGITGGGLRLMRGG